ncbi:MAG: hypothetical protein JWR83_1615 [Aeromicrobium sp.]|nr:hypothetical protein [Aeromicrobium sp.]
MGSDEESCDFCSIARGDADATFLAKNESWMAFFPLRPATKGHTLVVPVQHFTDYWSAPPETVRIVGDAALRVGRALQSVLEPPGMNLITSAGNAAEQTVFHLHLHVVPRWPDDAIGPIWPDNDASDGLDTEALAARVRGALTGDAQR